MCRMTIDKQQPTPDTMQPLTHRAPLADGDRREHAIMNTQIERWRSLPRLSRFDETELARRKDQGDKQAHDKLFAHTMWHVLQLASQYAKPNTQDYLDLVQEGSIALLDAISLYDWKRGYRLSTLAMYYIRKAIAKANTAQNLPIVLPGTSDIPLLRKRHRELQQEIGRPPTVEEIARDTRMDASRVRDLLPYLNQNNFVSLDDSLPMQDGGALTQAETISAEEPTPEEQVESEAERKAVRDAVDRLPLHLQRVVRCKYGFDDDIEEDHSDREVGRRLGLDHHTVSAHLKQAHKCLRKEQEGENNG